MIEIEAGQTHEYECECCGNKQLTHTRFVHRDGDAHAIYYATYTEGHHNDGVLVALSIGNWWEDGVTDQRDAFALNLWSNDNEYGVTVLDWLAHMWPEADLLGRRHNREVALKHPHIEEAFHITNHIFAEDIPVKNFLNAPDGAA